MTKQELETKTEAVLNETHDVLQLFMDELNQGQRKKMARNEKVAPYLERYGVEVNDQ